jgi:hypothetical protein
LDIPLVPDDNWAILKFDPVDFINQYFKKEFSALGNVTYDNLTLREITVWSTISIRGIYVTNTNFNLDNLPTEMCFKTDGNRINLHWLDIPEETYVEDEIKEHELEQEDDQISVRKAYKKGFKENFDESIGEIEKRSKELFYENLKKSGDNLVKSHMSKIERDIESMDSTKRLMMPKSSVELKEMNSEMLKKNVNYLLTLDGTN